MKLPYRAGDSFALPLGDGTFAPARITACDHHTVDITAAGIALRVSDRALVLRRWRADRPSSFEARLWRAPQDDKVVVDANASNRWLGPAHAERIVATALGVAGVELPPLIVRAGAYEPEVPTARNAAELASLIERAAEIRALRIAARGMQLDAGVLAAFTQLEVLDCSGVAIAGLEELSALPLRALRLAFIAVPIDLRALDALQLRVLALEALREARGIDMLRRWVALEQLEMLGFWQFELADAMPLLELPALVRAEIDIGGRRKNVELYRRARWAYPWPFLCFERMKSSISPVARGSGSTQIKL